MTYRRHCALLLVLGVLTAGAWAAAPDLLLEANLKTMGCAPPDTRFMFVRSSQPGNVFYPGDRVDLVLKVTRDREPLKSISLEVIEIATRQNKYLDGFSVMSAPPAAENLGPRSKIAVAVTVEDRTGATAEVLVKDVPVPGRYGTYAVRVLPNDARPQFLCTLVRAMRPKEGFAVDAPVFGEGQFLTHDDQKPEKIRQRALALGRLGIKGVRIELGWAEGKPGAYDWDRLDALMNSLAEAKIKALVTMGGHPSWTMPFGQPTPACIPEKPDHSCMPRHLGAFGKWIEAFCSRYWNKGQGALWAIENWNEPWEGISISGWESDSNHFRDIMKQIADNARKVDKRIKTAAACSIMNTEDKFLTGENRRELIKLVDLFTDHYVPPRTSYGPMVAKYWGKQSTDTETWIAATEMLLPQVVCQFLACGQDRVTPWHPEMTYFSVPGATMKFQMPNPVALASNVFNAFITEKPFQRVLFMDHLPWAFQFGEGKDATVVFFGKLFAPHGGDLKDVLWWQLQLSEGGTITLDNADGALEFHDIAGNLEFEGRKHVTLPMDYLAHYVRSPKGGAKLIAERLGAAKIEGVRPVEIIARDLTRPLDQSRAAVKVTIHNLLNRAVSGTVTVTPPAGIRLKTDRAEVKLEAGAAKDIALEIAEAKPAPANAYLFGYAFTSDAGKAEWREVLNVLAARKGAKKIDGNLDEWAKDLGVMVDTKLQKADPTQQAWMPFLAARDAQPTGSFGELKAAWDDKFFYVAACVNDPSDYPGHERLENRDENKYFRSAKDDAICETLRPFEKFVMADLGNKDVAARLKADARWAEFEKFLADHADARAAVDTRAARVYFEAKKRKPAATFADASYVYKTVPWDDQPWAGDSLQFGFDVLDNYCFNMKPDTDRVPYGFHAMPDTDYEFAAYACADGGTELWRLLAPGMPRGHFYPRQPRANFDQGPVKGGQLAVRRQGKVTTYELAIPWSELKEWKPKAGQTFGLTWRVNNNRKPDVVFGADKSAAKTNGLSLHPYWEAKPGCGVRWGLVE